MTGESTKTPGRRKDGDTTTLTVIEYDTNTAIRYAHSRPFTIIKQVFINSGSAQLAGLTHKSPSRVQIRHAKNPAM